MFIKKILDIDEKVSNLKAYAMYDANIQLNTSIKYTNKIFVYLEFFIKVYFIPVHKIFNSNI